MFTAKLKTKKSALKRFKVTKTGKVIFRGQYQGHLMRKKSSRRKRRLAEPRVLQGTFAKKIKKILNLS